MPGFHLNELIDIYIEALAPKVRSDKYGAPMPCYIVYQDVMKMLKDMKARGGENDLKFYKSVIGDDIVHESPEEYSEMSAVLELGGLMAYRAWDNIPIEDRAKIMAQRSIYGMIQIISRYYDEMADLWKRKADGK